MKPFSYDPAVTNPVDVARRDYIEFFIEKILDHRGDLKRKTSLYFKVKWLDYDETFNSWESYSNLLHAGPLHDYLRHHNLKKLIPKTHLSN